MTVALLAAAVLVAVATAVGLLLRARDGRPRPADDRIVPQDVGLGAAAFGDRATLLQFSTATCARCPGVRRLLTSIAADAPGVRHAEVDLTDRLDLARRFDVLQTPTTLVLDGDGRVHTRIAGAPARATVLAALAPQPTEAPGGTR